MKKIDKDMTIGDVVDNYPHATEVLSGFGMHCFSCPMSRMETIEEASAVHGLEVEEVEEKINIEKSEEE